MAPNAIARAARSRCAGSLMVSEDRVQSVRRTTLWISDENEHPFRRKANADCGRSRTLISEQTERAFRQCGIDVGVDESRAVRPAEGRELTLGPPGCSRTRACVSGAQSSNGPDQGGELSSGVLVISIGQLFAMRRGCAACLGYHACRRRYRPGSADRAPRRGQCPRVCNLQSHVSRTASLSSPTRDLHAAFRIG